MVESKTKIKRHETPGNLEDFYFVLVTVKLKKSLTLRLIKNKMKKTILLLLTLAIFPNLLFAQTRSDAALARVISQDETSRDENKKLVTLSAAEHLYRADVYMANRHFSEAREHWQKILDNFPEDSNIPKVLFGIARSYMWEREYQKAVFWFDKLTKDHIGTKDGREGLAFKGASYVRWGKNNEAAKVYEQYIVMFPTGERIESAYLNLIDALREAEKYDEANAWVEKARTRFARTSTETNALHGRLRLEIYRKNWNGAIAAADDILFLNRFYGSMTSLDEIKYLKAFALEKAGRKAEAIGVYTSIPDSLNSYYGGLAAERLKELEPLSVKKTVSISSRLEREYPVMYRSEILRFAKLRKIDPRFLLAIMKQESSFRAGAKSPAAARGLLQLVYDTALKYNKKAGYPNLQPDDLYNPTVNIAIGSLYVAELKDQFDGVYEAIAASYNGGEDNAARWLNRSRPKEPAIFAAEVGFAETKNYVFKVMNNYRVYRELYNENLLRN